MDEADLIGKAQDGDREAFAELVCRHQARLRAIVALTIPGRDDVHDIVQEAFIDAWKGLAGFDRGREFGPWLRTICRNRARQFLRERLPRRRRELALVDEALLAAPLPDDDGSERLAALRSCLAGLTEEHRRILALRYADEAPVQDIAVQLGKSPNGISMILLRLKAGLLRCIAERLTGTAG
jgi:RNA polymerase sigma-70 factor (ECF subfamily)